MQLLFLINLNQLRLFGNADSLRQLISKANHLEEDHSEFRHNPNDGASGARPKLSRYALFTTH